VAGVALPRHPAGRLRMTSLGEFGNNRMTTDTAHVTLDLRFWIAETANGLRLTAKGRRR